MTRYTAVSIVFLGMAASLPAPPGSAAVIWQPASSLPRWMAGCWAGERGGERFEERWIVADEATLLSIAYTTKAGRVTAFEFVRVVVRNGKAIYIAQPGGAPPTEFTATTQTDARVVFENPSHDFPKRVIYERGDPGRLTASIDGGSGTRATVYAMRREPCGE